MLKPKSTLMNPTGLLAKFIFVVVLLEPCAHATEAISIRFMPESANDLTIVPSSDGWQIVTQGDDPYVVGELSGSPSPETRILDFEYFSTTAINQLQAFIGPPITVESRMDLPLLYQAEGWHRYSVDLVELAGKELPKSTRQIRLDFGNKTGVKLQLRSIQLRSPSEQELQLKQRAAKRDRYNLQLAQRIDEYLSSPFPDVIHRVHITIDEITIEGSIDQVGNAAKRKLMEIPIWTSIGDINAESTIDLQQPLNDSTFRVTLARRFDGRDRLHSSFVIVNSDAPNQLLSPRTFATEFAVPDETVAIPPKPRHQKGLACFSRRGPEEDLRELDISAVTINLLLNGFVTDKPGKHRQQIPVDGPPIYFDSAHFASFDDLIRTARKHEIVVSAIVLIHSPHRPGDQAPLAHNENDGGVYAMPNIATRRGALIYAFVLDQLAMRYRDPLSDRGGITNWIAHNEIDFHRVWTNMGKQPRQCVTETYYRSLRMIHNAAHIYQPHARVFASLTHHWVVPDDGAGRQLAPRDVIDKLARYSRLEGDFAWGVGYHPYPESLFADVAWRDKSPTDSYDTPLITFQNLSVLTRYLEQTELRDGQGKVRGILLSEQGFHTPDYSDRALTNQADSLAFAIAQVRKLPLIESLLYHRWIDHPDEGGLKLGLRTLPTREQPYGMKKKAWDVYRNHSSWE